MKRLLFTVTNDLNFDQRMIRICSTLEKEGYEVTLVGRKKKDSQVLQNQSFTQKRFRLFFQKGILFYAEFNLRLFFWLIFKRADLICLIDLDTLPAGLFAGRLSGKKVVYDAHEYFTEVPEVVERPRVQKVWSWVANFCIPKVDGAYTVGGELAQIFEKKYNQKFEVIRNVPYPQTNSWHDSIVVRRIPEGAPKKFTILYQGALNDGRGLEEMIEAMSDLPDCELWLAGEGDLSTHLRELTNRFAVADRVKFWGWVLPNDLKSLTLNADLGINLLKNKGLNYYYSLANKAFDYVQAEKPAIHMQFPEYQSLNREFEIGTLIPDLNPKTIRKAILDLKNDSKRYADLKANCAKAKKVWNWEKESIKLAEFYKNIFNHAERN